MKRRLALFLSFALTAAASAGTNTSAEINKALDTQRTLEIDTTLPEAMKQIANQTDVRIQADPAVWDLLPWGEETNIKATIKNHTLRDGLTAITRKLGLEFSLEDEAVELKPMRPLRRLGRRATVLELSVLDEMASKPMNLPTTQPTVKQLLSAVDDRLDHELHSPFAVDGRAPSVSDQPVSVPRNATIAEALEAIDTQTSATWYPWGKSIVVLPKSEQIRGQLSKTITTRYTGVNVGQVLLDLSTRAGVRFIPAPNAYQQIPKEYQAITLTLDSASIQQCLDTISGYTGLGFEVQDDGVHVANVFVPGK